MTERWYYTREGVRQGPVPRERLADLAREGWLAPDDLVWTEGMADWQPARSVDRIFAGGLARSVQGVLEAATRPRPAARPGPDGPAADPSIPSAPLVDWERLAPRHLLAAGGAMLAALGIAFATIAFSKLAFALFLGGLVLAGLGLHVELAAQLPRVRGLLDDALAARAEARAAGKRLRDERLRLERESAATHLPPPGPESPVPAATVEPPAVPALPPAEEPGAAREDDRIVVYHLPVRLWHPGVAALLSLALPGLGQLYRGAVIAAAIWFVVVVVGYRSAPKAPLLDGLPALGIAGMVLHAACVLAARSGNPWSDPLTTYERRPAHWQPGRRARRSRPAQPPRDDGMPRRLREKRR